MARARQLEKALNLHQGSRAALTILNYHLGGHSESSSRIFRGTIDQVAAVRRFVRSKIGDHPALRDVVLAASELAANAIGHTASGDDGGLLLVHLTTVSARHIAVLATDQGGQTEPQARHAAPDAENGRGLDVVTSIASLFATFGDSTMRTVIAVIGENNSDDSEQKAIG